MKKPLIEPKRAMEIYEKNESEISFNYKSQEVRIFINEKSLTGQLKNILGGVKPCIIFEDFPSILNLKEDLVRELGEDPDSKFIISLGGAMAINRGKIARYQNQGSKVIIIPTTCSNDSFLTNTFKNYTDVPEGKSQVEVRPTKCLLPDYLIIDNKTISELSSERLIYSGWGELVSSLTSYEDWKRRNLREISEEDLKIIDKLVEKMFSDTNNFFSQSTDIKESVFLLMRLLFIKTLMMLLYDDYTIGASSDHLFSYSLEKNKYCENMLHGEKVLVGVIVSCIANGMIYGNRMIEKIPKQLIKYITAKDEFKEIIDTNLFKSLIIDATKLRPERTTVFNQIDFNDARQFDLITKGVQNA